MRSRGDYSKMRKESICVDCRGQNTTKKSRCLECLSKIAKRRKEREKKGLCHCGSAVVYGRRECRNCLDKASERSIKQCNDRIKNGLCGQCGKNTIDKKRSVSRCSSCLDKEKNKARDNVENRSRSEKKRRHNLRNEVLMAYGGIRCSCCGETNPLFLSIDHIDGGGTKHRKSIGGSSDAIMRFLKREGFPSGYQVLCHNCNQGRFINGGKCPHESGSKKNVSGYTDDPENDGTDFAHPAFWRGEEYGVLGAVMRMRDVLDGKDDGSGILGNKELEQIRRDLLSIKRRE